MIEKSIHKSAVIDVLGRAEIPPTTIMEPCSVIYIGPNAWIVLGDNNIMYPNSSIRIDKGWMKTGVEVSFGPGVQIYEPRAGLEIGDYCMIGAGTLICGVNHGIADPEIPMRHQQPVGEIIIIEDDVWIGMGVVILPGIRIGKGAVIGAGSVATKDVPPLSVGSGVPFSPRRQRPGVER